MQADQLRELIYQNPPRQVALPLCAIIAHGIEAQDFLQGQLTLDLRELKHGEHRLTAWCNAKGRVWALLRVLRRESDFLLILPLDQKNAFLRRIRLFVLRAKVQFEALDDAVFGYIGASTHSSGSCLPLDADHGLWVTAENPAGENSAEAMAAFKALRLLAAEPQITSSTQEQFLPQSLGLEELGGLHYNKGCYVGQEIVARVHYRGRSPQRLRLLIDPTNAELDGKILLDETIISDHRLVQVVEHCRDA